MDLTLPITADAIRSEVRTLLRDELPESWRGEGALDPAAAAEFRRGWRFTMMRERLLAARWPERHGGRGLGPFEYSVLVEELVRAGVPLFPHPNDVLGVTLLGPALLRWGTPEQQIRFLGPTLDGRIRWAQGYSEPDAGSDLFALRCRARLDGNEYIVSGQKVWQTAGLTANWIFALVRTDPTQTKARGLSMLMLKLDQPGVTVRGIDNINGNPECCEVFFDDARTSVENVIGAPGEGAKVALSVLGDERGANGLSLALSNQIELERLSALTARMSRKDEAARERLGRLSVRIDLQRALALKLLAWSAAGREIGILSSMVKLRGAQHRQEIHEFALEVIGTGINELTGEPGIESMRPQPLGTDPFASRVWAEDYLNARAGTIYGGSSQIQRNTIGERLLGLPREPTPSSDY